MFLQLIFQKRRRAVSPVIAMVLIIALALSAGAFVVALLNGSLQGSLGFDTDASLGSADGGSSFVEPTIEVIEIQGDPDLKSFGVNDYVEISVRVTNNAGIPIYVFDVDIIVYGQKLDEIRQWNFNNRPNGAIETKTGGEFSGFLQPASSVAEYTVSLAESDYDVTQARIPEKTTFTYELLYGKEKGVISGTISKTKLGEEIFSPTYYDVAIFHSGSNFAVNTAARQYENTVKAWNGTNFIYFNYDRSQDAYDYVNAPGTIDGVQMILNYDIVIVDVWAVPASISAEIQLMHKNATKMIFYGSVSSLGASTTEIMNNIDVAATDEVLGVTPNMFQGNSAAVDVTDHYYQFFAGSSVLTGLENKLFEEIEDDSYTSGSSDNQSPGVCGEGATATGTGIGDIYGYDIATFTGNASNYIEYGVTSYDFKEDTGSLQSIPPYPTAGALFVEKFGDTTFVENDTLAYSFIWKHNNALGPAGSDLVDGAQLGQVRINMLAGVVGESNRVVTFTPSSSIDMLSISVPPSGGSSNKVFDMSVTGTIENADVFNGSLTFSIDMPEYEFHDCNPSLGKNTEFGSFFIDGIEVVSSEIVVTITTGSVITVDMSNYIDQTLSVGSTYTLALGVSGTEMFKINADETLYEWAVTVDTGAAGSTTTRIFERSVDSGSDVEEPNKVTGLSVDGITESTIDLSWTAATDNGGGTIALYSIYRDNVFLTNTTATSFTDSGLAQNTTYSYKVRAVDDSGNAGAFSDPVSATTSGPPPAVASVNATTISSSRIDLNWSAVTNVDGYRIYRNSTLISTLTNGSTYYADGSLNPSTTYTYDVYAWNNTMQSNSPATATNTTFALGGGEPTMYIQNIAVEFINGNPKGDLNVIVTIYDENNQPLSGVSVSIEFVDEEGTTATYTSSGVTGADGTVTMYIDASSTLVNQGQTQDAWTATVTSISKSGYVHDSGSDVESSISGVAGTNVA